MKLKSFILSIFVFTMIISTNVYAGEWVEGLKGWIYTTDSGYRLSYGWEWIDGNNDGTAECYYFRDGYMFPQYHENAGLTLDGYLVNNDGAWVENGKVVTKKVEARNNTPSSIRLGASDMLVVSHIDIVDKGTYYNLYDCTVYKDRNPGEDKAGIQNQTFTMKKDVKVKVIRGSGYLIENNLSFGDFVDRYSTSTMIMLNVVQDKNGMIISFMDTDAN